MNIIVLAGGHAKRLGKITENYPKFLLRLAGKPALYYVLKNIKNITDFNKLIIAFDEKYKQFFLNDIEKISDALQIFPSLSIHGMGNNGKTKGPIRKICDILRNTELNTQSNDFLVLGGDNIFGFDLNNLCLYYKTISKSCVAINEVTEPIEFAQYGIPRLDDTDRLIDFEEKPTTSDSKLISTACYVLTWDDISLANKYLDMKLKDSLGEFIRWLIRISYVYGYRFHESWYDIGTREGLLSASRFLIELDENRPDVNLKHGSSEIVQPVYIDTTATLKESTIGPNVYIGARASIVQSVIKDSIIYDNCNIEQSELRSVIVGDNSVVREEDMSNDTIGPNYGS